MMRFRKKVFFAIGSLSTLFSFGFILFQKPLYSWLNHENALPFFLSGSIFLYGLIMAALFFFLSRSLQLVSGSILTSQKGEALPIALEQLPRDEFLNLAEILNSWIEKVHDFAKQIKENQRDSEEILDSISEGVILIDSAGKVSLINKAAGKILQIVPEEVLGQSLHFFMKQGLLFRCHEMIQHVLQASESNAQTWNEAKEGGLHLELIAKPRQERRGVILILQDKTSHYKILEMDKDFIANASHELRTPITIIQGFAETLRDHPNLSSQTLAEVTEKIVKTSQRLESLIQSLLVLADIDHSEYRMVTTDLTAIATYCKELVLTVHPTALIHFSTNQPNVFVMASPQLLDLAIMNLLENAVKYSSHPPSIEMSIQPTEQEVRLEIRDQGIGIPETDLPYIFDRFYTVDKARSRKSGGAGLGLSLVKTIIEKHQGTISVASQLGVGSAFTISLPKKAL